MLGGLCFESEKIQNTTRGVDFRSEINQFSYHLKNYTYKQDNNMF